MELLLEPHGIVTDSVQGMGDLLDKLGHEQTWASAWIRATVGWAGRNRWTSSSRFGRRIEHVHWKDMSAEWEPRRGKVFGCGMATIPLGDGVVGIREVVEALLAIGFEGVTTLEIAGAENIQLSLERLRAWSATGNGKPAPHFDVAARRAAAARSGHE